MSITSDVSSVMKILKGAAEKSALDTTNPFKFNTDQQTILNALNSATDSAYDLKTKEANLGLNRAEDTAYANTQNAMRDIRQSLAGGVSSGANQGMSGATALQALLGLGQQNTGLVTEGLQGINKIADERAAALQQNAVEAISQSNAAKNLQATAANEKYNADSTRSAEALAALGALTGTRDTNVTNERMNNATNSTNKSIAKTTQKQEIKYRR